MGLCLYCCVVMPKDLLDSSYGQSGIWNEVYNVPIFTRSLWAMNHRTWNYLSQLCKLDIEFINCKLRNLANSVSWLESSHLSLMELRLATESKRKGAGWNIVYVSHLKAPIFLDLKLECLMAWFHLKVVTYFWIKFFRCGVVLVLLCGYAQASLNSSYGQLGISNEVYNVPIFTRSLWAMNHEHETISVNYAN